MRLQPLLKLPVVRATSSDYQRGLLVRQKIWLNPPVRLKPLELSGGRDTGVRAGIRRTVAAQYLKSCRIAVDSADAGAYTPVYRAPAAAIEQHVPGSFAVASRKRLAGQQPER